MALKDFLEKGQKERKRKAAKKTAKNVAIGAGIGTAVGIAAGVLLAPKAGKETREDIAKGAKTAVGQVKESLAEAKEKLSELKEKRSKKCCGKDETVNEVAKVTEEVDETQTTVEE
ncbi:MAG: YtxH domain-containing protein [Clostridia bacterium]|nr:YtxH domain-containing protein [Clostridia bacterium]